MRKFFSQIQYVFLAGVLVFAFTPLLAMARGYDSKPVTGVYAITQMGSETAIYADGTFNGTSGAVDDCAFFYIRPYGLDDTLDLIVMAGPNSYTATYTYKIKADADNTETEFGPFYMDETDATINYYLALTTNAAPAASAAVYVRGYRPVKHNY